jgi:hypothetical protein
MIVARPVNPLALRRARIPLGFVADGDGLRAVTPASRRWTRTLGLLLEFLEGRPLAVVTPEHVERVNRRIDAGVLAIPFRLRSVRSVARLIAPIVHQLALFHLTEALAREHAKQLDDPRLVAASIVDQFKPPV